jgi:hypothetical protein
MKQKKLQKHHWRGKQLDKDGVVIDANIMSNFYHELVKEYGPLFVLIQNILRYYGIAISTKIESEWKNTTGNQLFNIWFDDQLKLGLLGYVKNPKLDRASIKKIHNDYGLPRNEWDIEYIKTSNMTNIKYILTYDIHFFDPKKKKASKREKERVKNKRQGALCRYLKSELCIRVGLPEHCCEDLHMMNN